MGLKMTTANTQGYHQLSLVKSKTLSTPFHIQIPNYVPQLCGKIESLGGLNQVYGPKSSFNVKLKYVIHRLVNGFTSFTKENITINICEHTFI